MRMRRRDFESLGKVAEAIFLQESAQLAGVTARENRLREDIGAIRRRLRESAAAREGEAAMCHPEIHAAWSKWCAQAIAELEDDIRRLQPEKARLQARVRESFGRHMALARLIELNRKRRRARPR